MSSAERGASSGAGASPPAGRLRDLAESGWLALTLVSVVTVIGLFGMMRLNGAKNTITRFVPATRSAVNVDMIHDAVRSDVYVGQYHAAHKDAAGAQQALTDLDTHITEMQGHLGDVADAPISAATRQAWEQAKADVADYGAAARSAIEHTDSLEAFNEMYETLEEDLGAFGGLMEADAAKASAAANRVSSLSIISLLIAGGLAVGLQVVAIRRTRSGRIERDRAASRTGALTANLQGILDRVRSEAETLTDASRSLSTVSTQLASGAEEAAAQVGVVSSASEETASIADAVTRAVDEMRQSIIEISRGAHDASRTASDAVEIAAETRTTIERLGQSSAEIGQVVEMIASIAESTNMLALNATIESARAGEAGKGFAVVASEVKDLAAETAKATEDIKSRVARIQAESGAAAEAMVKVADVVAQIHATQGSIAAAVEEQTATTNEIARSMGELADSAGEITRNITGIAAASNETASGATITLEQAHTLSVRAGELQRIVDGALADTAAGGTSQTNAVTTAA